MRSTLTLASLAIVAFPLLAAEETAADYLAAMERSPRLRLNILDAASLRWDVKITPRMVVVGRLDPLPAAAPPLPGSDASRWQNGLRAARQGDPLETLATADAKFLPPRAGGANCVFLLGPELNSAERWGPVALTRSGNTLTLLAESWTDNAGRRRNIISRQTYLLSLPGLEAGKYELRFVWRSLFRDASKRREHYACDKLRAGRMPFTVEKADAEATAGKMSALADGELKLFEPQGAEKDRLWQTPGNWFRALGRPRERDGMPAPGLFAGALDLPAWLQSNPKTLADLPRLSQPEATSTVLAVVLGPELNTGEQMTLREVEWKGKEAIVRVEVWRDTGERSKNIPFFPVLAVYLNLPTKIEANRIRIVPGDYTIRVEWSFLQAPAPGGLYQAADPTKSPLVLTKTLKARSEQKFTIR